MDKNLPMDDDLIRYFDKEMTESEQRAFELKLQADPLLKQELEKLQMLKNVVTYYSIQEQVKEIRKLKEAEQSKGLIHGKARVIKMNSTLRRAVLAAASIIFILATGITYVIYNLSPEKVFTESYVPYTINNSRSAQSKQTNIEEEYNEGKYDSVIKLSKQATLTGQEELINGISYMQLNQLPIAIDHFKNILASETSNYKEDAEYYLALTYLKSKEYTKALPILEKINGNANHLYHNQITNKIIREVKLLEWK